MTRSSIALICSLGVLLAGCGGSSHSSASSDRKSACVSAIAAKTHYRTTAQEGGLSLTATSALQKTIAALAQFRSQVQRLASATAGTETQQLSKLATDLTRGEKALQAFIRHDKVAAAKYSEGLNQALETSLANLEKICAKS